MPATKLKAAKTKAVVRKGAASPARRAGAKTYTCTTCGKVTKDRSHLCNPAPAKDVYMCAYCGATAGDPAHVCSPLLANLKFFCKTCGRVTPYRGAVCQPKEIK